MPNEIELNNNYINHINYTGKVSIKLYSGNKFIKEIHNNNHGTQNLFRFFTSCLHGLWGEAKGLRPCKLVAFEEDTLHEYFNNEAEGTSTFISSPVDDNYEEYWTSKFAVSPAILYNRATTSNTYEDGYAITFNFRIPSNILTSNKAIKKLALVPSIYTGDSSEICAYYILDEAIVLDATSNYTVIVDWQLILNNAGGNN